MPELPEVEITARNLRRWLARQRIVRASIARSPVTGGASPRAIEGLISGRRVDSVDRRGKWLALQLSGGAVIYAHLGMTGKWVKRNRTFPAERFERARLDTAKLSVRYLDPRLFGRIIGARDGQPPAGFANLGPDPLKEGIDVRRLGERLARTQRSIKEALMDQTLLAGLGNIQAAEALWRARIFPGRIAAKVAADPRLLRALATGIRRSVAYTLRHEEAPELTYVEEPGSANPFKVYGRLGEPCPLCHAAIERMVQGGRSTYYCKRCQRA